MAFGLRTYGANGALQINENSFTIRAILSVLVDNVGWTADGAFSGSGYKQWAVDGNAGNATALLLPVGSYSSTATQFEAQMLDGVARVYNYNRGFPAGAWAATAGSMRLIVVRFA
jgi:hypothetical protein